MFDVPAATAEYRCAAHGVQTDVPLTDLKVPGTHGVQLWRDFPVYPTSHRQSVRCLLPATEFEFGGQCLHSSTDSDPISFRYVPTGQSVQLWSPCILLYFPI